MGKKLTVRSSLFLFCLVLCPDPLLADLTFEASWEPPSYAHVRQQALDWVHQASLDRTPEQKARTLWPLAELRPSSNTELLDRSVEMFSIADPRVEALINACHAWPTSSTLPSAEWLNDEGLPTFCRSNLRLYYGRWLAQNGLYDKLLAVWHNLKVDEVIDPATLLFYRAVAHQQLVHPEKSRAALSQLMEQKEALPLRYRQLGEMMQQDLAGLKDESLDHVARRMNDVRRRLELGYAGKQVQVVEKGIVDSLDRLIDKAQKKQKQVSGSIGSGQGAQPMQDSRLPSLEAPMQVDQRDIGHQTGWGDLPPKQREQALQQINRDFPGHYRDLIEQYFRELAAESSASPPN